MTAVYLINLDRDVERLERMRAQLEPLGLDWTRVPGVLGEDLPDRLRPAFQIDGRRAGALSPGEIGCYASHLVVLERIAASNAPGLVLEDDLNLPADLPRLLADLARAPGWDIVRLSNRPKRGVLPVAGLAAGRSLVRYSRVPNNTGAYLITAEAAARFLALPGPRTRPIDEDLKRPWTHRLETFGVFPAPVVSNIGPSTIDQMGVRILGARRRDPLAGLRADFGPGGWRVFYNIRRLGLGGWLTCALERPRTA